MNKPLVSFVVLSWNTLEDTKTCISNLKEQSHKNTEIIIVDNGSTDGSKDYLKKLKGVTYVDLPANTGFTGGQIEALRHCRGDYIALINSDAVLDKNWTKIILDTLSTDDNVAAAGGKVYEWNDANKVYDTRSSFYAYQKVNTDLGYAETKRGGESVVEVDSISGAAVMIKRSVIEEVGYFDSRFFAYFEETDLFARYQKAGYKIMYQPNAHAWHQIAKSSKSKPYFYLYHMHRNRFMFGFKNFDDGMGFLKRYIKDGLRAHTRYLKNKNLDDKARIAAMWWNIFHIIPTISARNSIQSLPQSYDESISNHHEGSDITVVIPSYNYAKYLPEAIESALKQTLKPHRVLVIDDGSTDDSLKIARRFSDVEVLSKKNEGVVKTKNLGISKSSTSWTIFLDADDVLSKDYLEQTYNTALQNDSNVVYTDMKFTGTKKGTFEAKEYTVDRLLEGNFIHNSALMSTTMLKNIGGYKTEMSKGYEDWELYLTLAENNAKFDYNKNTHLEYRQHNGALGRNSEAIEAAEKLWETARSLHEGLYAAARGRNKLSSKIYKQIQRNPLLIIMFIILIPYSMIKGIRGYFSYTRYCYEHSVRTYIHERNTSRVGTQELIDEGIVL